MVYLMIKRIKGHQYLYLYHQNRRGYAFVNVHTAYLGSAQALLNPASSAYDADVVYLYNKKLSGERLKGEDRDVVRRIMRGYGIHFSAQGTSDRADLIYARRTSRAPSAVNPS